jgi:hypothetical protein
MTLREINKAIINKYSQLTLSKFDIIGSYFVNLYYNEFYIKAKNLKNQGTYGNITEAYKNLLSSYVEFSKQPDFFKQIVKGIHTYCISTTRYTTMSHKECIDFMFSEFVPTNLWNSLRENQKNKLFHESLINCIKEFTENIILNHLYIIIDNHDKDENIIILQDLFLAIILVEKDKIFSKFINPNKDNLELFKKKIQQIIVDKKKIIEENLLLSKKNDILTSLNKKNSNIILELQKNNKMLTSKIVKLKESESNLNKKLMQYMDIIRANYNNKQQSTPNTSSNTILKTQPSQLIKKKPMLIKQSIVKESIVKEINQSDGNDSINNESINNDSNDNESIDNESIDNESIDNKDIDDENINNDEVNNNQIDENSVNDEQIDDESYDNKSIDEEFESYFNTSNIPIVRDLEFEQTDYYE